MSSPILVDTFAEANKDYFNKIAHGYDELPHAVERARRTAAALIKAYNFDENSTTIMEYACGTGLVSRELAQYAKRIVGVDISQGMVDKFNKRVENQGIPLEEMQAICVELKGKPGELDDEKFDAIVCASAYHHFASIDDVTRVLTYFLKPSGMLLVVDLMKLDHEGHGHGQGHGHEHQHSQQHIQGHGHAALVPEDLHRYVPHRNGLSEDAMRSAFEGAGLTSFSFSEAIAAKQHGEEVQLFLATGVKPA